MICKLCEKPVIIPDGESPKIVLCGRCLEKVGQAYNKAIQKDYCCFCWARLGEISLPSIENDRFCIACWNRFETLHGHSPGAAWRAEEKARILGSK